MKIAKSVLEKLSELTEKASAEEVMKYIKDEFENIVGVKDEGGMIKVEFKPSAKYNSASDFAKPIMDYMKKQGYSTVDIASLKNKSYMVRFK